MTLYFEDLAVDDEWTSDEYAVTEAEIREFADQYDPQWFHTDPDRAAEKSPYGGLIASGWHTAAMSMRLLVDCFLTEAATMGAKGVDELRWREPVQPGDRLSVRATVLEREVDSDQRGTVRLHVETTNAADEVVFSMVGIVMFARRDT
ncbi:MaoC family dehydratase [Halohasta litorea]|uniref:MaoC family dehydratase n=1 Tax=Halohasta litorea TaxID=869891 RepID=A0ABD6DC17_9EURY|nr:MaoC family dehydratase [Halohasta litorea]